MMEYKLVFRSGSLSGREETFTNEEMIIGRDPAHRMAIDDPKVSRDHLKIYTENGQLFLVDLESTNGTFVNGKHVTKPVRLKDGDLISLGDNNVFEVQIVKSEPQPQSEMAAESAESAESAETAETAGTAESTESAESAPAMETGKRKRSKRRAERVKKVAKPVMQSGSKGGKPAGGFFASLPTWAVVLFIAVGFFILFCLIPFVIIEVTDQWCNLFSGFFNAISPGVCP